jgi:hypothetical protein
MTPISKKKTVSEELIKSLLSEVDIVDAGGGRLIPATGERFGKILTAAFQKVREDERKKDYELVREFIHKLFGDKSSINGVVELSSHDIQAYGNEILTRLTPKDKGGEK